MDVSQLKTLQIFTSLNAAEIQKAISYMEEHEVEAGTVVFEKDAPGGTMYIVLEGEVEIQAVIAHDLKKSLAVVPPGAVFGELSLFTHEARSATAIAQASCRLLSMDTPSFERMLMENPAVGSKILIFLTTIISDRLRNTTDMYRNALEWSLSVSGAINLHIDQVITGNVELGIRLISGDIIKGRLLKVDQIAPGYVLFLQSEKGKLQIVPYHAVMAMSFDANLLDLKPHDDLL